MAEPTLNDVPIAELNISDLSTRFLAEFFGNNWWTFNMSEPTGWAKVINSMLEQLNEFALFCLTFIFIVTYVSGVIGTAHEGKFLGEKFHSFWVPVRMVISSGMLIPIKGLCLFQILILISVGFSIDYANRLWETFMTKTTEIFTTDLVSDYSQESKDIVGNIISNLSYSYYYYNENTSKNLGEYNPDNFVNFVPPEFRPIEGTISAADTAIKSYHYEFRNTRKKTGILDSIKSMFSEDGYTSETFNSSYPTESMGSFYVPCDYDENACTTIQSTIMEEITALQEPVHYIYKLSQGKELTNDELDKIVTQIDDSIENIQTSLKDSWSTAYAAKMEGIKKTFEDETSSFMKQGWITAGAVYHSISVLQSRASEVHQQHIGIEQLLAFDIEDEDEEYKALVTNIKEMTGLIYGHELGKAGSQSELDLFDDGTFDATGVWILGIYNVLLDDGDPIQQLSLIGHTIINLLITLYTGMFLAGLVSAKAGSLIPMLTIGPTIAQSLSTIVYLSTFILGPLGVVGFLLAYYIPAIPFIIWVTAVVGWLIVIIEVMVAAPFWIVAQAMPDGDGFAGQHGREGYMLFMSVLIRPFLMLFGLLFAIVGVRVLGPLLLELFKMYFLTMTEANDSAGGVLGFTGASEFGWINGLAMLYIFTALFMTLVKKLFSLIAYLPDNVMRWVGARELSQGGEQSAEQVSGMASNAIRNSAGGMRASAQEYRRMKQFQGGGNDKEDKEKGDGTNFMDNIKGGAVGVKNKAPQAPQDKETNSSDG